MKRLKLRLETVFILVLLLLGTGCEIAGIKTPACYPNVASLFGIFSGFFLLSAAILSVVDSLRQEREIKNLKFRTLNALMRSKISDLLKLFKGEYIEIDFPDSDESKAFAFEMAAFLKGEGLNVKIPIRSFQVVYEGTIDFEKDEGMTISSGKNRLVLAEELSKILASYRRSNFIPVNIVDGKDDSLSVNVGIKQI